MMTEMQEQEELIEFNGMNFSLSDKTAKFVKYSEKATTRLELYRNNMTRYLN